MLPTDILIGMTTLGILSALKFGLSKDRILRIHILTVSRIRRLSELFVQPHHRLHT